MALRGFRGTKAEIAPASSGGAGKKSPPAAKKRTAPAPPQTAAAIPKSTSADASRTSLQARTGKAAPAGLGALRLTAVRVLLVEDDPAQADPLAQLLRWKLPRGSSVAHASSLAQARAYLTTETIDVVLLDLGLPDSAGIETVHALREAHADPAIIILSAHEDEETVEAAVQAGADDYFVKGEITVSGLARAVSYAVDRNRQARALAAAVESRQRVLDSSLDVICTVDREGRFTEISAACEQLWGHTREEMLGRKVADWLQPGGRDLLSQVFRNLEVGVTTRDFQNRHLRRDGSVVDIRWSAAWSDEHQLMYCVARDVTERTHAEQALRASEARFRQLADSMPIIVWAARPEGEVDYYNQRWHELTGTDGEETARVPDPRVLHPDDVARCAKAWRHSVATGEDYLVEYRFYDRQAGEYRWYLGRATPVRDESGNITRWYGTGTDIHEVKLAQQERERASENLERRVEERTAELAEANRELEAFSYSVSHDLRAPLRAINGFSRILLEEHTANVPPKAAKYLQNIEQGARQMGQLVDDLLTFSRLGRQALTIREVDAKEMVETVLAGLQSMQDDRRVEIHIEELPRCRADATLLQQVWVNLLSNALKYTRERDPAVITIGSSREEGVDVFFVRDNGAGFDMTYADKLFGVFQRLHRYEDYEGTGVGLALVQRIVHRHGGRIWAEAEVERGATFFFTLESAPNA